MNIDTTSPLISPANNLTDLVTFTMPIQSIWNYTATDPHIDTCYFNNSDNATYQILTACNNSITTSWVTSGSKTIQFCANDTNGLETCNTTSFTIHEINHSQSDTPDPAVEGDDATFSLNVNLTNIPSTTAKLILNGTSYSVTGTATTNAYVFSKTINIPNTFGNITGKNQNWFWNYTIAGIRNQTTATQTITVYELDIDDCSSYGEVILNLSLFDEEGSSYVNETAGANIEVDLVLTSATNSSISLTYNHTFENDNNPAICLPVGVLNSTYNIDFTIGFDSTDHVWEFFYLDNGTLNSSKQFDAYTDYTINLMDLLTTDSTSFLFNYFDEDGLPVEDALVHVFRKYIGEGSFKEVERSKVDQNGDTIVHLVEEDVIYYFMITQYGDHLYTSSTYTALCQETPCSIQVEAGGESASFDTDYDLIDGGSYDISSNSATREISLTYLLDQIGTMNFTAYKLDSDGSYSSIATNGSTGISDTLDLTIPQSAGNVSFFVTVEKDNDFINSEWVDFEDNPQSRFGTTLSLFLAVLIILSFGLIAVSEGVGTIIMVILGVAISGFLGLITTALNTGISMIIYLIITGGILVWKLSGGRK